MVSDKMSEELVKAIGEIQKCSFIIPEYQRGYRWKKNHVTDLLSDILAFKNKPNKSYGEFYCLQPVVVKKINGTEDTWEVIDGQQRLTTLFLILQYALSTRASTEIPHLFSIKYQMRKNSGQFLQNPDSTRAEENADFFHIHAATEAIGEWFNNNKENNEDSLGLASEMYSLIRTGVKIIWYEVSDDQVGAEVFRRLNTGKIPLTNAELIKALFLNNANFQDSRIPPGMPADNSKEIVLRQFKIASEWDNIEYFLQNKDIWGFLGQQDKKKDSRIEHIFAIIKDIDSDNKKSGGDHRQHRFSRLGDIDSDKKNSGGNKKYFDYPLFNYCNDLFNQLSKKDDNWIEEAWQEIKKVRMLIEEWYNNSTLYHYIGYCLSTKIATFVSLIQAYEKPDMDKGKFVQYLMQSIKEHLHLKDESLTEYNYNDHNAKIMKILLLFNIEQSKETAERFSFFEYMQNAWSLEHIRARHQEDIGQKEWLEAWKPEHLKSLRRCYPTDPIIKHLEACEYHSNRSMGPEYRQLINDIIEKYSEDDLEIEMDGIQNLTILDKPSNSSLGNSVFDVKRFKIIQSQDNKTYIPLATRRVFAKHYSPKATSLFLWEQVDATEYMHAIKRTLKYYLSNKKEDSA